MKVPEADRRADSEAANTRGERFVYGFSGDPGAEDDLVALCGGKGHIGLQKVQTEGHRWFSVPASREPRAQREQTQKSRRRGGKMARTEPNAASGGFVLVGLI